MNGGRRSPDTGGMTLLAFALSLTLSADAADFWNRRGGVESWCKVAAIAQQQQELARQLKLDVKISIITHEQHRNGRPYWRMRLNPELQIVFWGPVPWAAEELFRAAVAYYKTACRL